MNTADTQDIDYGPLTGLIGVWTGDGGMDIAPEPDGTEHNPYYETITFTASGDVTNAEEQVLSILRYHQIVQRKSTGKVFHNQTGYWMYDPATGLVIHSLTIPRAVCLLAGGTASAPDADGNVTIKVAAGSYDEAWQIVQSPFMTEKARTTGFQMNLVVGNGRLSYSETTMLDIYGKVFEHTDENALVRTGD